MNLYEQLTQALAIADAKILEQSKEWALYRMEKVAQYKAANPHTKTTPRNWAELFEVAGGKIWYEQITYGKTSLMEFVTKNAKRNAEKRNTKIALQLENIGILSVISGNLKWNDNGFDGCFIINTDKGQKTVRIETITAGGYNVQCFHLRVLVKIK